MIAVLIALLVLVGILYFLHKMLPCTITALVLIIGLIGYTAFVEHTRMSDTSITICAFILIAAFAADIVRPFLAVFRRSPNSPPRQ